MNNTQKKVLAQDLYIKSDLTQIEIANLVGVTDKTIRNWATKGDWGVLKGANQSVAPTVIATIYKRIQEITEQDPTKYARAIKQLVDAIEKLSKKPVLSHFIFCLKEFNQFLIKEGKTEEAKILNKYQREFINDKASGSI